MPKLGVVHTSKKVIIDVRVLTKIKAYHLIDQINEI